jgi:hypothetical protein
VLSKTNNRRPLPAAMTNACRPGLEGKAELPLASRHGCHPEPGRPSSANGGEGSAFRSSRAAIPQVAQPSGIHEDRCRHRAQEEQGEVLELGKLREHGAPSFVRLLNRDSIQF